VLDYPRIHEDELDMIYEAVKAVRFLYFAVGMRKSTKTRVKTEGETAKTPFRHLDSIMLVGYHYSVLLSPRNWVLREKPIVPPVYKKVYTIHGIPIFITVFTSCVLLP